MSLKRKLIYFLIDLEVFVLPLKNRAENREQLWCLVENIHRPWQFDKVAEIWNRKFLLICPKRKLFLVLLFETKTENFDRLINALRVAAFQGSNYFNQRISWFVQRIKRSRKTFVFIFIRRKHRSSVKKVKKSSVLPRIFSVQKMAKHFDINFRVKSRTV